MGDNVSNYQIKSLALTIQQLLSFNAGSTLVCEILATEGVECAASAHEVTIALIANLAILLGKVLS